jgi:mono/diheme cytochrome c family protein
MTTCINKKQLTNNSRTVQTHRTPCGSAFIGLSSWLILLGSSTAVHSESAGQWQDSQQLWRATCQYCHDTGIAPELHGTPPVLVQTLVRNGFNQMPAFTATQISDNELTALAGWIARRIPTNAEKSSK